MFQNVYISLYPINNKNKTQHEKHTTKQKQFSLCNCRLYIRFFNSFIFINPLILFIMNTHVTIIELALLFIGGILVYTLLKTIWQDLTQYKK